MNTIPTTSSPANLHLASRTYKVVIADDHEIFRDGLALLLKRYPSLKVVGEAGNGKELRDMVESHRPDLVFLDLNMPVENGMSAATEILQRYPDTKIIILTFYDDAVTVERMMKLGASAFITKSLGRKELEDVLTNVINNRRYISADAASNLALHKVAMMEDNKSMQSQTQWLSEELTPREKQVLLMIIKGQTHRQIADQLHLSTRTVETHKVKLLRKTGTRNTAELIAVAHQYKLVD